MASLGAALHSPHPMRGAEDNWGFASTAPWNYSDPNDLDLVMRNFQLPGRSAVFAGNGMASTSHPLAAAVAIDTLKSGGNAMDAAIAGAVLLGICEPAMTGIGGDLFVLLSPPGSQDVLGLNGSGRAPARMDAQELRLRGMTAIPPPSAHAVTIPGAVDALCVLSEDWGLLGLERLFAPAIRYAEEGVPVAPRVAFDWAAFAGVLQGDARKFYLKADGTAPAAGERFVAPQQAKVLRRIAREGRRAFYEGEVAEDMLAVLTAAGGFHDPEDFASTACEATKSICGTYKSAEIHEHPPNGQGATALLILNILKHFDLTRMDPFGAARAHVEAEATKLAYGLRNRLIADPACAGGAKTMLSDETAADIAAQIDLKRALPPTEPLAGQPHRDTIYITVVDRDRMAVSLIYSIFRGFGSGLASPKYGILLHNRGSGFTLEKGHPNEVGPGKRPMHTIIPGIVRRSGHVAMPFGVMGGQYQATGHARLITNIEDFGLDVQAAIDGPRSFAIDGELQLEHGYDELTRNALADLGHVITTPARPIGGAQAIVIDTDRGILIGGSDPRKDGCALGY